MGHLLLALMWIAWCILHSAMISTPVTEYLKRRVGEGFRFYRLVFNLVALMTVAPVVLYERSLRSEWAFWWEGPLVIFQIPLLLFAFLLFFAGSRHYDFPQFLGVRQIWERRARRTLSEGDALDTSGILRVIRHPWYAGAMIAVWARGLTSSTLVTNVILTVYLIVGTYLEERKLLRAYGDAYRAYQKRVSMFVPYRFIRSRMRKEEGIEHL